MRLIPLAGLCNDIIDCPHETPEWKTNGVRIIRNFNIQGGRISDTDASYVDEETYRRRIRRATPEKGDLIISREAPMGPVALVPEYRCCLGQRLVLLKTNKKICYPSYLLYVMLSDFVQKQIKRADTTGSIVSNLTIPNLKDLIIPVPEYKVQVEIGNALDSLTEKIANNTAIISELESMAKDIYNYWFVQFDFPDENGKPYKSSGGKMVWNEQLKREIPEGWKVCKSSELISSIHTGLNPRDNFKFSSFGTKYITVKNLSADGLIDFSGCDYIDEEAHKIVHERSDIRRGDILYASISPIGRSFLIQDDPTDWDINESVFSIRPNYSDVSSEYLQMLLTSDYLVKQFENSSVGSIFKGVRIDMLQNTLVFLPSKKLIDDFTNIAKPCLEMVYERWKENSELTSLRDWLLPMLMNGQVKVG